MAEHKDLTGAELHEPKGQSTAAINTVYVADGAGSGTHQKITEDSLDLTDIESPNTYRLAGVLADVSTASSILIPVPEDSTFVSARVVLANAITVADSSLSFARNDGSSFGSALTITQSGSAEGTGFTFTPTLNTAITGPGYIKVTTDGGSTTTAVLYVVATLSRDV